MYGAMSGDGGRVVFPAVETTFKPHDPYPKGESEGIEVAAIILATISNFPPSVQLSTILLNMCL